MKQIWVASLFVLMGLSSTIARAEPGCNSADVLSGKLITDICWDCIFPLRIAGGVMAGNSSDVPDGAADQPLCFCTDDAGVPRPGALTSFYEPHAMVEFQRVPGCSSVLNGTRFPFDRINMGAHARGGKKGANETFMHYHWYVFPLMKMLEMFTNAGCNPDGYADLDLLYMSEIDPTWNNPEIAFFSNPEAAAVANPVALLACSADAVAANTGHPLNSMFWCAGDWASTIYPLSGDQYTNSDVVENSSLLSVKVLAALHRRGLAKRTIGNESMCNGKVAMTLPKSQYKFTMFFPTPETKRAHVIGETTWRWGQGRMIPGLGEDPVYMVWRYMDCCNVY